MAQEIDIPISKVRPDPTQPRRWFDPDKLHRLSISIRKAGQKQAMIVRPDTEGITDYVIVDGERRWRACQMGHIPTVRAVVDTPKDTFLTSVICNFGREGHTPLEIANAITRIRKEHPDMTMVQVADMCTLSTSACYLFISLCDLAPEVKAMLDPSLPKDKQLKVSYAFQLAKIVNKETQIQSANHIVNHGLTILETRKYLADLKRTTISSFRVSTKNRNHDEYVSVERFARRIAAEVEMMAVAKLPHVQDILFNKSYSQVKAIEEQLNEARINIDLMHGIVQSIAIRKKEKVA